MMRSIAKFIVLLPIYFYRLFISPLLPPHCRFQPTCSQYALDAVRTHGGWAGLWLTINRIRRCHPLEKLGAGHGFDPVPVAISRTSWYAPWKVKSSDLPTDLDKK